MGRRANGEGSIYQLPDGRWRVSVSVRSFGTLRRISRIRKRRADCVAILDDLRRQIGADVTTSGSGTLGAYLERWLATAVKPHLRTNTHVSYEAAVRKHISPRLGSAKLAKLTPTHLEEFKSAMVTDGVKPRAAQCAFQVLRAALTHAVYPMRLIPHNPCDGLKPPKHAQRTMQPFDASEVRLILETAEGTRWHALYAVAFGCGLRIGELLGLEWRDVDWTTSTITINRQLLETAGRFSIGVPKTASGVRRIKLPASVKDSLRRHRSLQISSGKTISDLVFPTIRGTYYSRANLYADEWKPRLLKCGLAHRGFHNTRHTFATLTLAAGVDVAVVARNLGHSSPVITYRVYSHVVPSSEGAAADAMQRIIA